MIVIFYGQPNRDTVNSVDIFLMDPKYEDARMVLIEVKGIIAVNGSEWVSDNHKISYTTIWR